MSAQKSGSKIKRPRRNLRFILIEPFKQIKLGLYVVAMTMAFVTVAGIMFVAAFTEQYTHVMNIFQVVDPNLRWELVTNDVFYTNAIRLGVLFVTFIGLMMAVIFKMTHRVYGPLVSIDRFLGQISEGQYGRRVHLRAKDDLQKLAAKLNEMAEALERRHGQVVPNPKPQELAKELDELGADQEDDIAS